MEEEIDCSPERGEHPLPVNTVVLEHLSNIDQLEEDFEEQDIDVPICDEGNDLDDEDRRSSSTPTQDDNVSPIGGIKITSVPPLHARLTDRLLSTLSESHDISGSISFKSSQDNQDYQENSPIPNQKLSDQNEVSDHEQNGAKNITSNISRASDDERDLSNLSPVSNNSLHLETKRLNEDDISLSDLSDPESPKNSSSKSDLEDGEIMGMKRLASLSPVLSPKPKQNRRRQKDSSSSDSSSSRKSNSKEKESLSDASQPRSHRSKKTSRGSTEFRQKDTRSKRIRRDTPSVDPETSPRQNAPSTRSHRRRELPRYDVRNIINSKRDARKKRNDSVSHSKSRSRSRSRSRNRTRRRSRDRSRNRSSSRGRLRSFSKSKSLSRSKSRARRRSFSREKKRPLRRRSRSRNFSRSISNEKSRNGRRSRSRSHRSRSRSLSSFSRRRNSSDERTRKKSKRNYQGSKKRLRGRRSRSRSPSVIIEQVNIRRSVSRYPVSAASKRRRKARSPSPPPLRKKTKTTKKINSKVDKLRKKAVTKKGKPKKPRDDVGKTKKKKSRKLNVVGGSLVESDLANINTHVTSEISEKEVFTSGDKIMVSVNFRSREPRRETPSPPRRNRLTKQKAAAITQKPVCVIDMLSSPYRIIEESPKEIVEILSDSDDDSKNKKQASTNNNNVNSRGKPTNKRNSPKGSSEVITIPNSPPQVRTPEKSIQPATSQPQQILQITQPLQLNQQTLPLLFQQSQLAQFETTIVGGDVFIQTGHKGPCTPPPFDSTIDLTRGPQTPSDPPDDSYDPCNPTESPVNMWESQGPSHKNNDINKSSEKNIRIIDYNNSVTTNGNKDTINSILSAAVKALPFLFEDVNGTTNGNGVTGANKKIDDDDHDDMDLCDDMDIGSPNSPQSSEMSDIFEPPLNTPKKIHLSSQRGKADQHKTKKGGKLVHMKMVDDKLRIIDDVPSSAVEMAVKEKFLIKVQRQERAVDEIKMVLKPIYNRKKIDKEAYKEILRKCVPKVCHSKKGDINPQKIHKLVTGYVKRYIHLKKKGQQHSF